jgi:8-oxo-dGTP pyrophosphatase MutT (NUDIX family)
LPKGTPEVGETSENTACREVEEETGLRVEILDYIGFIEYDSTHGPSSGKELKRVHYFLMRYVGGDF